MHNVALAILLSVSILGAAVGIPYLVLCVTRLNRQMDYLVEVVARYQARHEKEVS